MKLFGHRFGHENQQLSPENNYVNNPQADAEADRLSEAAWERVEHPETIGQVTIKGAVRANESNVVEMPTAPAGAEAPTELPEVPTDHQLTA